MASSKRRQQPRPSPSTTRRYDPLLGVTALGSASSRTGFSLGLSIALLTHGAALASPMWSLLPMQESLSQMRSELNALYTQEIDIEPVEPPAPEPEPEPEPAPEPEPQAVPEPTAPTPEPEAPDDPYDDDEPPPAPAEAADVITQDDGEAVDLTGWAIVDKDGSKSPGGGWTSEKGTAKKAVQDPNARVGGTPGGKGTGKPKPPPKNRSRAAKVMGWNDGSCAFPAEADQEQINSARVTLAVTVSASGKASRVQIISAPPYGFALAARQCALRQSYRVALDRSGRPISATTAPFIVRFVR